MKLLSSPRIRLVDLSYLDDASGRTLLHEAARRKDLRLIELAVRAGADIFVRDRRGRAVYDSAGKDDRVRAFLRQCKVIHLSIPPLVFDLFSSLQSQIRTIHSSQNHLPNHQSLEVTSTSTRTLRRDTTRDGSYCTTAFCLVSRSAPLRLNRCPLTVFRLPTPGR